MIPAGYIREILNFVRSEKPSKRQVLTKKKELAKKYSLKRVPSDIEILTHLSTEELELVKDFLLTKPVRSGSGVSVVAVMTKPIPCPHGKCTYCPGGPQSYFGDVPQSYTGFEPAAMRGRRVGYDIYAQVFNRLEQYIVSGHSPEKVEAIIMGGTFPSFPEEYQDEVIRDLFKAMNDFSKLFYKGGVFLFDKFKEFFELPGDINDEERSRRILNKLLAMKGGSETIEELQRENETSIIRCVGLTIETRPTHATLKEALRMLSQGCTRVELGVQVLFDDVLEEVHRGHTVADTRIAFKTLKDLGFKINAHIMLGLPLMNPERDLESINELFTNPDFRPDMLKIYPCIVLPGTKLYYDYLSGDYKPYTTEEAADIISEAMRIIPRWCRVMRVQRDIPSDRAVAGVDKTNLRQLVDELLSKKRIRTLEIRSREVRDRIINDYEVKVTSYEASGGREFFIEVVEPATDIIIGFCRLRFPGSFLHPEIDESTAIIRELHVYGRALSLRAARNSGVQHRGFGKLLLETAESIAKKHGRRRVVIISGVGVREYYRRLGYSRAGPYMAKELAG